MNELNNDSSNENHITDLVMQSVESWESLNAKDIAEGDVKFRTQLINAFNGKKIGEYIGRGEQFIVNEIEGIDNLVVKRLRAGDSLDLKRDLSLEEYFEELKRQHSVVHKYYGDRFVPKTEFIEVDHNFDDPTPESGKVILGHEYLMVQEKIEGEDIIDYLWSSQPVEITENLKRNLEEFVQCYRNMQNVEKAALENQFKIDERTAKVSISDTNHYFTFDNAIRNNFLLEELGISFRDINSSEDIIKLLSKRIPELESLQGMSYHDSINMEDLLGECPASISGKYPDGDKRQGAMIRGFRTLITAAEYFPPNGMDNKFITRIINKFKLF